MGTLKDRYKWHKGDNWVSSIDVIYYLKYCEVQEVYHCSEHAQGSSFVSGIFCGRGRRLSRNVRFHLENFQASILLEPHYFDTLMMLGIGWQKRGDSEAGR